MMQKVDTDIQDSLQKAKLMYIECLAEQKSIISNIVNNSRF